MLLLSLAAYLFLSHLRVRAGALTKLQVWCRKYRLQVF
jgi:hypothetical protein